MFKKTMAVSCQYPETIWKRWVIFEEIIFLKYFNLLKCAVTLQQHFPMDAVFFILI